MFRVFEPFNRFEAFAVGGFDSLLKRIQALFSSSDGVWIEFGDASQLNELYDQSGAVPVDGDPVGYVADQSVNGSDATQAVSNKRPTLGNMPVGGRRNIIDSSEDLTVGWNAVSSTGDVPTVTANSITWDATSNIQRVVYQLIDRWVSDIPAAYTVRYKGRGIRLTNFSNAGVGAAEDYEDSADWRTVTLLLPAKDPAATVINVQIQQTTLDAQRADTTFIEFVQVEFGTEVTGYQRTEGAYDVTEAGSTNGIVLYNDLVDDELNFTPPAIPDANWIMATPYGTQISRLPVEAIEQPVPQSRELIGFQILEPLTEEQRQTVLDYWASKGAGEEVGAVWTTNETTIYHEYITLNGLYEIKYFGANGATTSSTSTDATVDVAAAGLTAPIVVVVPKALMSDDDLTLWYSDTNNHTGPLPDISGLVNLGKWYTFDNNHTGPLPDISGLLNLTSWSSRTNSHTGPLPDISGLTKLIDWYCHTNNHDGWLGGTIPPATTNIRLDNNDLDESAVNGILIAVEANGTSNGLLYLDGGTNAVPTGAGLTAYNALDARGWDVRVNS